MPEPESSNLKGQRQSIELRKRQWGHLPHRHRRQNSSWSKLSYIIFIFIIIVIATIISIMSILSTHLKSCSRSLSTRPRHHPLKHLPHIPTVRLKATIAKILGGKSSFLFLFFRLDKPNTHTHTQIIYINFLSRILCDPFTVLYVPSPSGLKGGQITIHWITGLFVLVQ